MLAFGGGSYPTSVKNASVCHVRMVQESVRDVNIVYT